MKQEVMTACPLDCWDACSMIATVEDGRVVSVRGNAEHPITQGYLCGKTMHYPERMYSPDRIVRPMRRRPGDARRDPAAFEAISWDDALDLCTRQIGDCLAEGGPVSILHIQAAGSMGLLKKVSKRFFNLLGGATELAGDVCFGAGEFAMVQMFGEQTAHSPEDIVNSRLVVLWGRNPLVTNTHMLPFLAEARRRGALVVSINPRRIDASGTHTDWQLQVAPGRDVFLVLALLREFITRGRCDAEFIASSATGWREFREYVLATSTAEWLAASGVSLEDFQRLLFLYSERRPAAIWAGSGVQHNSFGVEVMAALGSLAAVAGNVGVPGGGISFFPKHRKHFATGWLAPNPHAAKRELPAGEFWKSFPVLNPPVRLVWVSGSNPVRSLPDSRAVANALRAAGFVVAVDFHWSDTVLCADLVLPHPSFLEEGGVLSSYGHNYVARMQPAGDRVGESRTDLEIFQALAGRLGFGDAMAGSEIEFAERFLAPLFAYDPALSRQFIERGFIENPLLPRVPWTAGRFSTPDGRFHFPAPFALELGRRPQASAEYPLQLVFGKMRGFLNSQLEDRLESGCYEVRVHPATASSLELAAGAKVCVRSKTGSVPAILKLDDTVLPGIAVMAVGGSLRRGNSVNQVVAATMARDGACPAYNDTFVTLDRQ